MKHLFFVFFAFCCVSFAETPYQLSYAYAVDDSEIAGQNAQKDVTLMSVFKFHLALAVLKDLEEKNGSLEEKVFMPAQAWAGTTYSPLRPQYQGRDAHLTLRELIAASVPKSDNVCTDALIDYLGSPKVFEEKMRALGSMHCKIRRTELEMTEHKSLQLENTDKPAAVVELLRRFVAGDMLSSQYREFLMAEMESTTTGANKLRAGLPPGVRIGHKTGSSSRVEGMKWADNDVGYIYLPDGRVLYIAVFVENSRLSDEENAAVIARTVKLLYTQLQK